MQAFDTSVAELMLALLLLMSLAALGVTYALSSQVGRRGGTVTGRRLGRNNAGWAHPHFTAVTSFQEFIASARNRRRVDLET
jgi:hypothetical protein